MSLVGHYITDPMIRMILAGIAGFLVIGWCYIRLKDNGRGNILKVGHAFMLIGFLLNITVFFANGGYMPSLSRIYYDGSMWVPMRPITHYNFLGDRFAGCSIGDIFLFAGFVIILWGLRILIHKSKLT